MTVDGDARPLFINVAPRAIAKGQSIRVLFEARDSGADSLIETATDDVRVYKAE